MFSFFAPPKYVLPPGTTASERAFDLLQEIKSCVNTMNKTVSASGFVQAYHDFEKCTDELIWLNEKKRVKMNPSPRTQLASVQRIIPQEVNTLALRALEKRCNMEMFMQDLRQFPTFYAYLIPSTLKRINQSYLPAYTNIDPIVKSALEIIYETGQASVSILERRLRLGYADAARIMDCFESLGIISAFSGSKPRSILLDMPAALSILAQHSQETENELPTQIIGNGISDIDSMPGHEFEQWCAGLLRRCGFSDVEVTRGSGDQGVDVLAVKDGIHYAIQCKCYTSDLGNTPVQEVYAGKSIYKCHVAAVMTNRHFTKGAIAAAEATGVLLWDREKLQEMLQQASQ